MKPWLRHTLVLGALALFTFWPVISVAVAGAVASANGCVLHEGGVNPCVIGGRDYGQQLYTMGVMGWFMLLTLPVGGLLMLGYWAFVRSARVRGRRAD